MISHELIREFVGQLGIRTDSDNLISEKDQERIVEALAGRTHGVLVVDAPYQRARWCVLESLPEHRSMLERRKPLLVRVEMPCFVGLSDSELLTADEVAAFFRRRLVGQHPPYEDFPLILAPSGDEWFATGSIGGDRPASDATTMGSSQYTWFDLNKVRVGESVYRICATPLLWVFTRREEGWEVTVGPARWPKTQDIHNMDFMSVLWGAYSAELS